MANNEVTFPTLYKSAPGGKVLLWSIAVVPEGRLGAIVTTYGQLDGKKQTMSETIEAGKNAGRKNATTPFQQAVAEAQSRWNKKKDRNGYGLTAEASAIVRGSSPMLAQVYEANIRKVDWSNAACQPKLDGFRLVARADDKGKVSLYSRENKPMSVLSHICETADGNPFESTAHGTIEEKQQHWRNRQNAIGKMLTVRYQKMTETDAPVPFQPVSVGFRE